jgi:sugar/nucleoside kinase (ribokinase family)
MDLKPHYDILIPGHYFCDLIFTGIPAFPSLGSEIYCDDLAVVPGGIMNTVIALRRLGVNVGWLGQVGSDFFSRYVLEYAEAEGVDTSLLIRKASPARRVTVAVSYPEDRAFITYVDPAPGIVEMMFETLDRVDAGHLHFAGLHIEPRMPELLAECHRRGIRVSMDCQHREDTLAAPLVREIIAGADLFMPNRREAQQLTGASSLEAALDMLADVTPTIVIKNGADGVVACHEGQTYTVPAIPVTPVDTTGAGDVFNAGFLAALLDGQPFETCLRWGVYCGGMSTLGPGGISAAPTREQVEAWLRNL